MSGKTVYWNQAESAPLVLVTGNESYLASRAISSIKSKLRAQHPDLEVTEVAESEYSPGLLFTVAAPSLFAEPRLVIIQTASEGLLEDLTQLVAEPVDNCTVVVRLPCLRNPRATRRQRKSKAASNCLPRGRACAVAKVATPCMQASKCLTCFAKFMCSASSSPRAAAPAGQKQRTVRYDDL